LTECSRERSLLHEKKHHEFKDPTEKEDVQANPGSLPRLVQEAAPLSVVPTYSVGSKQVQRPQAPPREAYQGIRSFILLTGILGHEKVTDQAAPLRYGEVLVCSSDGNIRCRWNSSKTTFIDARHGL
jgi:hypothetical protein